MSADALLTADELTDLSARALVALAARSIRRVQPLLSVTRVPDAHSIAIDGAIAAAEQFAASSDRRGPHADRASVAAALRAMGPSSARAIADGTLSLAEALAHAQDFLFRYDDFLDRGSDAAYDHANAAYRDVAAHALRAVQRGVGAVAEAGGAVGRTCRGIRDDLGLLKASAGRRDEFTPIPTWIFALHSDFRTDSDPEQRHILEVVPVVDEKLVEYLAQHPEELYGLSPRGFEELIGCVFEGFGYTVELTARTRDGGRDIVAIDHRIVEVKYLIECKRYVDTKSVGVAAVRQLHGVVQDEQATKGILATTARRFTRDASEFLARERWVLEGRAFDGIVGWLRDYQALRLARDLGVPGLRATGPLRR